MKRFYTHLSAFVFAASLIILLNACSGIPIRSMPRLAKLLTGELLTINPAEFKLAIQADTRMVPPVGGVPTLNIAITPKNASDFEAVDKKIPLQLSVSNGAYIGLDAAPAGRRWLVYSFPAASQAELTAIQATFKRVKADNEAKGKKSGGTLSVGIADENIATPDSALNNTRWETWLQTTTKDGFYEVWSGTVGDVRAKVKKPSGN